MGPHSGDGACPRDNYGSVLLTRPYVLRHRGITARLYAGIPRKQIAPWAGHSVEIAHKTYMQIRDGFGDTWLQRIDQPLNKGTQDPEPDEEPPSP
jgi:hypothetical protein